MRFSAILWPFTLLFSLLLLSSCEKADGDAVFYPLDRAAVGNFLSETDIPLQEIVDANSEFTSESSTHLLALTDGTFTGYLDSSLYGEKDPALFLSYDIPVEQYATDAAFLEHEIPRLFEYAGFLFEDGEALMDAQSAPQSRLLDNNPSKRILWKEIRDGQYIAVTVYKSAKAGSYQLDLDIRTEAAHKGAVRELAAKFDAQEVTVSMLPSLTAPSPSGETAAFLVRGKLHVSEDDQQAFDNNLSSRLLATLADSTGAIELYVDNSYFPIETWEEERDHLIFYDGDQYLYIVVSASTR